jgi:2-oxoisovalerate dehydrogenase E1 component
MVSQGAQDPLMLSTIADIYQELERVDVSRDLDLKSLHVSTAGLAWVPAPLLDGYAQKELLELYYFMSLTRATDLEIIKMSRKGLAVGKHLPCGGNEATAVGATCALRTTDWVATAIRDLGAFLARGVPPSRLIAQACGRVDGLTGGWDGSLHMGHLPSRVVGLISHLGTLIPVGVGCAFAERYRGGDEIALAFVGDGTTSTGDVHEALNIAAVMRIPLVLVIENNQWAFGTPNRLEYATPTLALRAIGYGSHVEGQWIDGTNVVTVYDAVRRAAARVRETRGVSIIEAMSMRMDGHSLADPFKTYVPEEQLATWKAKDPITTFGERLLNQRVATVDQLRDIDERVAREVRAAAIAAEQSPGPDATDIEAQVFSPSPIHARALVDAPAAGRAITYHQGIREALIEELDRDPNTFIIGEDIGVSNGAFKVTEGFAKRFDGLDWASVWKDKDAPFEQRRVIDAPIAEAGFVGLALGAVHGGLRPIVEFQYADFASEAFKMIVNYAATQHVRGMGPIGIVFRLPSGWAINTSMYHSVNPESWFASTPGLKIVAPITAFDAKGLLKAAVRDNNPVLFLEYKNYYRIKPEKLPPELNLPVPDEDYVVPIGKGRIAKPGKDLTIISYGSQTLRALEAASQLEKSGASVEVIDLRTVIPLDLEMIQTSVRKTSRAIVTCEAPHTGCFGTTIVTEIMRTCFEDLDAPVRLVAAADTPVPFATALEQAHLPTVEKVVTAGRTLLEF